MAKGAHVRLTTKWEHRLKGDSKEINMKYKVGYLVMWLIIFKESMLPSSYQICTCQRDFKQEPKKVLELQHGRVTHMKEDKTK